VLSLAMTRSSASCSMLRARKSMAKEMLSEHDTASAGAFSEFGAFVPPGVCDGLDSSVWGR
jgi:hypothetical protein